MLDRSDIYAWSLLSPTPICCYHPASRTHLVYWQGIAMVRVHAMMIVQEKWVQSWSSPTMQEGAFEQFKRAYFSGAFGDVDWKITMDNSGPNDYLSRLRKWLLKHDHKLFENLTKQYTLQEAMCWFTEEETIQDG